MPGGHATGGPLATRLARRLALLLPDTLPPSSWPLLLLRVWRGYVLASGALEAAKLGAAGFKAGLAMGRRLIEDQSALLAHVLLSMNTLMGSPYAELLWCQAVGALVVGMLSELLYTSVLGLLAGVTYGFCSGYVGAVRATLRFAARGGMAAAAGVGCVALRVLGGPLRRLLRI